MALYPVHYQEDLELEISRRIQRSSESAIDYIIDLQTLIRRHGGLTAEQETLRLYRNLLPKFRQYIRRSDFWNTPSLVSKIMECEILLEELRKDDGASTPARYTASFNRNHSSTSIPQNGSSSPRDPSRTPPLKSGEQYRGGSRNRPSDSRCWKCGEDIVPTPVAQSVLTLQHSGTEEETMRSNNGHGEENTGLTPQEERQLKRFLDFELPLFRENQGLARGVQHHIRLKTSEPIKQRYQPQNPKMQAIQRRS
ncbi:hypothetical protein JTB14_015263 [Gonioctena quinquepunctata]|nr:hypothetical protein JTB14_015263 [Gonioctena quinquepunctata]